MVIPTTLVLVGAIASDMKIAFLPLLMLLIPFLEGSVVWRSLSYYTSVLLCFGLAMYINYSFLAMLSGVDSLSAFEGSNGEGSPIVPLIGMFFVTILFTIPWSIIFMRALKGSTGEC